MQKVSNSRFAPVRFADAAAYQWLWTKAPCSWIDKVSLSFVEIPFDLLEPATSLKHWDVLARWTRQVACRRVIPPLIVNENDSGGFYIQDGNHRYEALRICYRKQLHRLRLRVAVLDPALGYCFFRRNIGDYSTYVLVPDRSTITDTSVLLQSTPVSNVVCEMKTRLELPVEGSGDFSCQL